MKDHSGIVVLVVAAGLSASAAPIYNVVDLGAFNATSINNSSQMAGWSAVASGNLHPFLYSGGQLTDLGTLGGSDGQAAGINNRGEVTGLLEIGTETHLFLYSEGAMRDLGVVGFSQVGGINDNGQIAGYMQLNSVGTRAFLYTGGVIQALGTLGGDWCLGYG